eukprot:5363571-Pleurochrysis_carterae.AAC.7
MLAPLIALWRFCTPSSLAPHTPLLCLDLMHAPTLVLCHSLLFSLSLCAAPHHLTAIKAALAHLQPSQVCTSLRAAARLFTRLTDGAWVPHARRAQSLRDLGACVTPDGKHVVTSSSDRTARVWRLDI